MAREVRACIAVAALLAACSTERSLPWSRAERVALTAPRAQPRREPSTGEDYRVAVPCSFRRWPAPQATQLDELLPRWRLYTNDVDCAEAPDRPLVVCRAPDLGSVAALVSPRYATHQRDDSMTWLVVWWRAEDAPRHVLPAPRHGADESTGPFAVVEIDLDDDGADELVIAADDAYSSIGSRRWSLAVVGGVGREAPVSLAASLTFEPTEFDGVPSWINPAEQFFEAVEGRCMFHRREWITGHGGTAGGPIGGNRQLYRYDHGALGARPARVITDFPVKPSD